MANARNTLSLAVEVLQLLVHCAGARLLFHVATVEKLLLERARLSPEPEHEGDRCYECGGGETAS